MVAGPVRARSREWSARAMSEKDWQALIVSFARAHGWWVFHPHDSRRSEPGWPDLTLIRGRELIFVEVKKHNGKVSPEQANVIEMLEETGAEVHVWWPKDEPEVRARLSQPRARRPYAVPRLG